MNTSLRFWSKVDVAGEDECWLWIAGRTGGGYGVFGFNDVGTSAHRVSYELVRGPIPPGLHIDHLCRTKLCVNPWHLEAVTPAENNRRRAALKTHCPHGHEYVEANTYRSPAGHRQCLTCRLAHDRRRQAKRTAAVQARKAARETCAHGHPWIPENLYTDPRGYKTCRPCNAARQHEWRESAGDRQ